MRVLHGRVSRWIAEEGWGAIASPQLPGECWFFFGTLRDGFEPTVGADCHFTCEDVEQDGYSCRALRVAGTAAGLDVQSPDSSGSGYASALRLSFDDGSPDLVDPELS